MPLYVDIIMHLHQTRMQFAFYVYRSYLNSQGVSKLTKRPLQIAVILSVITCSSFRLTIANPHSNSAWSYINNVDDLLFEEIRKKISGDFC